MGKYLDQFQRFSEGISQTTQQGVQSTYRKITEAQRAQAVSAQNQAKARRKQELDLYKELYGKNRLSMADWQQADIDIQSQTLLDDWRNEKLSDEEMMKELQSIGTAANQYHKSWESALGDPDDEGNTATYYGNVNMVSDWAGRGINDYEDSDQIPVGFQNGFEGITDINNDRENKLAAINMGVGQEQFINSFKDPISGEWMITMGNPSDQNSHKTMPRKAWIEQLPGPGTFLPELTDINLRTMPEVAASNVVTNYVKNREDVDAALTEWFNNEMVTNKRFKKEIWNQFGESFFGDHNTKLKTSKDQWLTDGLLDIKYDTRTYQLDFSGVGGSWEAMVNDARNEFISKYKAQNAEPENQGDAGSRIRFDQVIPIEFNTQDAYQDVVEQATTTDPSLRGISPVAFSQLKPLTGLQTVMRMGGGEDSLVGATLASGEEFGVLDGELIGKFQQKVEVTVPTVDPATAAQYEAAGMTPPTEERFETVYYYRRLNASQTEAFYKELGAKLNYPPGERQKGGEEYIYNKYVLEQ